ncbi:acyl-CoA dehydrogenase [Nocardioides sp. Root1257]|uniref:phosphotransferase family protein n=1 Tax=unclassified Nocardioides TaxID=2615069 RepID=UPI0006F2D6B9|nr:MULTISPECIES: phosphotransferase family protein [unclassified Nocardioides]KQW48783.1 acyl-CoA dehydrogenase [Nocardioides sp. Root1257]KRC47958.1 acyl-CoA dehydrogenase [Nocardioides sp. Root224]
MTEDTPGLDLAVFRRWYDDQRPGEIAGDLSAQVIAGGRSNLTYEVTDGTSWWIVRRPPLGHVQATAHDMGREYTAMSALVPTEVPVPTTYAHCDDPDVLGAPFYVMERVDGTAYRRAKQLAALGPERTAAIGGRLIDVLATLHRVDPAEVGLAEFGRPDGFLERQVRRWGKQLEGSKTREHPDAEELHRRLTARVPAGDDADAQQYVGIVHGDYRLDNVLTGADDEIKAVVDWEMATLGDTRTDVALMLVYDRLASLPSAGLVSDVSTAPGYPGTDELLTRYAATVGRDLGDMGFHLGLAYFKLAVILEGINFRFLQGQTVGEGFDQIGAGFDPLIQAGLAALERD